MLMSNRELSLNKTEIKLTVDDLGEIMRLLVTI